MDGKLFLFLYVLYIVLLFIAYRFVIAYLDKRKLKKKYAQEQKLKGDNKNV